MDAIEQSNRFGVTNTLTGSVWTKYSNTRFDWIIFCRYGDNVFVINGSTLCFFIGTLMSIDANENVSIHILGSNVVSKWPNSNDFLSETFFVTFKMNAL